MKPVARHLLRFALPPPLGLVLMIIWATAQSPSRLAHSSPEPGAVLLGVGISLAYAYFFAGPTSFFFAVALAFFERRFPAPAPRLICASLLGLLSGSLIGIFFGGGSSLGFSQFGLVVGLTVETMVVRLERHHSSRS